MHALEHLPHVLELDGATAWAIAAAGEQIGRGCALALGLLLACWLLLLHPILQFSGPHGRAAMVELCAALDWQWGQRLGLLGTSWGGRSRVARRERTEREERWSSELFLGRCVLEAMPLSTLSMRPQTLKHPNSPPAPSTLAQDPGFCSSPSPVAAHPGKI